MIALLYALYNIVIGILTIFVCGFLTVHYIDRRVKEAVIGNEKKLHNTIRAEIERAFSIRESRESERRGALWDAVEKVAARAAAGVCKHELKRLREELRKGGQ